MLDEELQLAVKLVKARESERKTLVARSEIGTKYSGALARDVLETLQGKPNTGRAVHAWLSLVKQMAHLSEDISCSSSGEVCTA
mgnify:CR=1 FL=1|tara:strand:+ start:12863 stop:13114 length:252 start_codon:yes stop_codon:yes gene_type:complete